LRKEPLLAINDLVVEFRIGRRTKINAVSGVSLDIGIGETLGLVGESGCGKSTIARSIVGLQKPTAGQVLYKGENLSSKTGRQLRNIRPQIQMIFQDAGASLNPGRKIGKSIEEPLRVNGRADRHERYQSSYKMMQAVGLDPDQMYARYPFEFSGGQCQRVSIARALILKPRLLICDEPVSALDVSVQAQILNLLEKVKLRFNLTMLFISHDLAVVKNISDRIAVMYLGKICEITEASELYQSPRHPYSKLLLASIPEPFPENRKNKVKRNIRVMPSSVCPPTGCRFYIRCPKAQSMCSKVEPKLMTSGKNGKVACHYPLPNTITK
jgi:peptide/nickel transport system ATP-binding protein